MVSDRLIAVCLIQAGVWLFVLATWPPDAVFCRWYHGNISRDDVEKLMAPYEDGLFLVRESANYPGDYTLCVAFEGKVEHYHISIKDNQLTVDDETFFSNMVQLVEVRI